MSYLFAAYAVIWTIIFGYTLILGNRQEHIKKEVLDLKVLLNQSDLE